MSLVRWFRKNNKKVMAIVVIVIMVGFIGGSYLTQLGRSRIRLKSVIAYYGDNKEITTHDLELARQELEILRALNANAMLRSQDLRGVFLGELLFAERTASSVMVNNLRRFVASQGLRIADKQIYDIYNRLVMNDFYWILLKNEATQAGILISDDNTKLILGNIIPSLFNGASYSQVIGSLIRRGISEETVQSVFARLLSVLEYCRIICSVEDLTETQIRELVSLEEETLDVEFVRIDSSIFADEQKEPTQLQINEHYEKYKNIFSGHISSENPYGFGYKLNDMVRLEYIAAVLEDVAKVVPKPTQQQCQDYYQRNIESFKEQRLLDPNDPNLGFIDKVRGYGEVAKLIFDVLLRERIRSKAETIMREVKLLAEAKFGDSDVATLSSQQLKQLAGGYSDIAEQLSEKYQTPIYAGKTGLLNALEIQSDEHFGSLFLSSPSSESSPIGLAKYLFAVDEIGSSELGPFDMQKPKMFENIGPLSDIIGKIVAIVRIIEAVPASEPQSLERTIGKETLKLQQSQENEPEEPYSVKDKIIEDLKRLAAMNTAKAKAEEFIEMAKSKGWDKTLEKFNRSYKQDNEPNAFQLVSLTNRNRITEQHIEALRTRGEGNPLGNFATSKYIKDAGAVDKLYSLVPSDSNTADNLPVIMEFKPDMSYYCLKNVTVNRIDQEQYDKAKATRAFKEDNIQVQNLAAVYFNPENILKRMNFRLKVEDKRTVDANTPSE